MSFGIVCLAVVICAATGSPPYSQRPPALSCGANEGQFGCDLKCEVLLQRHELQCMSIFHRDTCVCNDGFYRTKDGQCVKKEDCPEVQCPAGSTWSRCGSNCAKGPRCDQAPCFDHGHCYPGCKCDAGYKVNADGRCVKAEACPSLGCGANEGRFGCDLKCEVLLQPYELKCMSIFHRDTCVCNDGFYRTKDGQCVKKEDCPEVQCPAGSTWSFCASGCNKGPSCDGTPCFDRRLCSPGCKCDAGYKVNADGRCIKAEACPPLPSCPDNETYNPCVGCQEETCEDFPRACAFGCLKKGCVCSAGFVRNGDGQCVRKADCPPTRCGENQVYKTCGSRCAEPKCKSTPGPGLICPAVCQQGCFCRDRYARNERGACVYKSNLGC